MSPTPLLLVDAFAGRPFAGNPAAVCLLSAEHGEPDDGWLRSLAAELDFPATAFVRRLPAGSPDADFSLRWFTAGRELELCGHGTLGRSRCCAARLPRSAAPGTGGFRRDLTRVPGERAGRPAGRSLRV
jgi:PhzF family phenazine biosynthesis protein